MTRNICNAGLNIRIGCENVMPNVAVHIHGTQCILSLHHVASKANSGL